MYNLKEYTEIGSGTKALKEDEFFSKRFLMSQSGLGTLMFSPRLFYNNYILKNKEQNIAKHLLEGKLIHCLLLTPTQEEFEKNFVISPSSLPSDSNMKILARVFAEYTALKEVGDPRCEMIHFQHHILAELVSQNLHQSLKTDEQRLAKILIPKNLDYWEYMKKAEGRDVIDDHQYAYAKNVSDMMKEDLKLMTIMGFNKGFEAKIENYNELYMVCPQDELPFDFHGYLDNIVIDHDNLEIRVNDLKTTSKSLSKFKESVDFYNYNLQAAMYYKLVKNSFAVTFSSYKFTFRFVVVDNLQQFSTFVVTDATLKEWESQLDTEINKAVYHFEKRNFELPYEFIQEKEAIL